MHLTQKSLEKGLGKTFLQKGFPRRPKLIISIPLIAVLFLIAGCAASRIAGNLYLSPAGGYQFRLPGEGWVMVRDGWKYQWELGYQTIFVEETYKYITRNREEVIQGNKVLVPETTRETDRPAHTERSDVFKVDTAFAYKNQDIKIIVAAARPGDLFRYLKEYGVNIDPQDAAGAARAYFQLYPSAMSWREEHHFVPDMKLDGASADYLELTSGGEIRRVLAGRLVGDRLVVAYYRAGKNVSSSLIEASRGAFMDLASSIAYLERKPIR